MSRLGSFAPPRKAKKLEPDRWEANAPIHLASMTSMPGNAAWTTTLPIGTPRVRVKIHKARQLELTGVVRGAGWHYFDLHCRSAYRNNYSSIGRTGNIGGQIICLPQCRLGPALDLRAVGDQRVAAEEPCR
jgi:hypothetical protein